MTRAAQEIREIIKVIPGAWVRSWKDGQLWVGAKYRDDRELLKTMLQDAGYVCECNGEPGTAGENIIELRR